MQHASRAALLLASAAVLAGCMAPKQWHGGPGGAAQFNQDSYDCQLQAANMYPAAMVQQMTSAGVNAAPPPVQTNCSVIGNQINCNSNRVGADASIYNRPPSYMTVDANAGSRDGAVVSCLYARGYELR